MKESWKENRVEFQKNAGSGEINTEISGETSEGIQVGIPYAICKGISRKTNLEEFPKESLIMNLGKKS